LNRDFWPTLYNEKIRDYHNRAGNVLRVVESSVELASSSRYERVRVTNGGSKKTHYRQL
jgi:hypothetical protein